METRELSEAALHDVPGVHALLRATVSNGKVAVDVTGALRRYLHPGGGGGLVLSLDELRRSAEAQLPSTAAAPLKEVIGVLCALKGRDRRI